MKKLFLALLIIPFICACSDDDGPGGEVEIGSTDIEEIVYCQPDLQSSELQKRFAIKSKDYLLVTYEYNDTKKDSLSSMFLYSYEDNLGRYFVFQSNRVTQYILNSNDKIDKYVFEVEIFEDKLSFREFNYDWDSGQMTIIQEADYDLPNIEEQRASNSDSDNREVKSANRMQEYGIKVIDASFSDQARREQTFGGAQGKINALGFRVTKEKVKGANYAVTGIQRQEKKNWSEPTLFDEVKGKYSDINGEIYWSYTPHKIKFEEKVSEFIDNVKKNWIQAIDEFPKLLESITEKIKKEYKNKKPIIKSVSINCNVDNSATIMINIESSSPLKKVNVNCGNKRPIVLNNPKSNIVSVKIESLEINKKYNITISAENENGLSLTYSDEFTFKLETGFFAGTNFNKKAWKGKCTSVYNSTNTHKKAVLEWRKIGNEYNYAVKGYQDYLRKDEEGVYENDIFFYFDNDYFFIDDYWGGFIKNGKVCDIFGSPISEYTDVSVELNKTNNTFKITSKFKNDVELMSNNKKIMSHILAEEIWTIKINSNNSISSSGIYNRTYTLDDDDITPPLYTHYIYYKDYITKDITTHEATAFPTEFKPEYDY